MPQISKSTLPGWQQTLNALIESQVMNRNELINHPFSEDPASPFQKLTQNITQTHDDIDRHVNDRLSKIDADIRESDLIASLKAASDKAKRETDRLKMITKRVEDLEKLVKQLTKLVAGYHGLG